MTAAAPSAAWLVKTEPGEYGWADLAAAGYGRWDGVRNALAQRHLGAMAPGDAVFVYHTGRQRAVVGEARVVDTPYPDPGAANPRHLAVDLVPVGPLARPVPLAELRADPAFVGSPLLAQGRLSVVPLTAEQAQRLVALAAGA